MRIFAERFCFLGNLFFIYRTNWKNFLKNKKGSFPTGKHPPISHYGIFRIAFLRWYYPDQVQRVGPSCPLNLKSTPRIQNPLSLYSVTTNKIYLFFPYVNRFLSQIPPFFKYPSLFRSTGTLDPGGLRVCFFQHTKAARSIFFIFDRAVNEFPVISLSTPSAFLDYRVNR